ncbi:MAG: hypothetical protein PHI12_11075 [Dehalococcoidales bacterium]|nr:hypothetical protein [Candidatus Thermoplasmatota archaeon]MDD5511330.1 hypothetical protein [Dehalococcoidales bacterium]
MEVWKKYGIEVQFLDEVRGGLPMSEDLVEKFFLEKGLSPQERAKAEQALRESQEQSEIPEAMEEMEKVINIFAKDNIGLYLNGYQVRAALAEAMSIQKSITSWRQKLQRGVRVLPNRLYLRREGAVVKEADGMDSMVVHVPYMGRTISGLKLVEFVVRPSFTCDIYVAMTGRGKDRSPIIDRKTLRDLLDLVEISGIGAMRSMGYGMCKITILYEYPPDKSEEEKTERRKEKKS